MTTTAHLTLHHFLRIPEQEPALEFDADGTIHEKMSPNTDHAALQAHLARLLLNWIDVHPRRRGGYVYTELRTNVGGASKLPDVAFYRHRRVSRRGSTRSKSPTWPSRSCLRGTIWKSGERSVSGCATEVVQTGLDRLEDRRLGFRPKLTV